MNLKYLAVVLLGGALGAVIGGTLFKDVPIFMAIRLQEMGIGKPPTAPQADSRTTAASKTDPEEERRKTEERIQAYRNDPVNRMKLLDSNGEVSLTALTLAGMSPWSGIKVKKIYDDVVEATKKDLASRITKDLGKTDEAKGIYAYKLKGDPEKSEAYIAMIEKNFTAEFGEKSARVLMIGLNHVQPFAGFGKHDLEVVIDKNKSPDYSSGFIIAEMFDVSTGDSQGVWNAARNGFRATYGDLFDFVIDD